jgi:hypothetical protein
MRELRATKKTTTAAEHFISFLQAYSCCVFVFNEKRKKKFLSLPFLIFFLHSLVLAVRQGEERNVCLFLAINFCIFLPTHSLITKYFFLSFYLFFPQTREEIFLNLAMFGGGSKKLATPHNVCDSFLPARSRSTPYAVKLFIEK